MASFRQVTVIAMLNGSEASRYVQNEPLRLAQGDMTRTLKEPWSHGLADNKPLWGWQQQSHLLLHPQRPFRHQADLL